MSWRGDWSTTERSGDGAHRNWISVEASSFPVHKVKWTLSCSIARKVTFPYQFLSCPSDLQLLVKQAAKTSQSRIPFPILRFKELGTYWLGGKITCFLSGGELELHIVVRCFKKQSALDKLTYMFKSTLSSLSGVKREVQLLSSVSNSPCTGNTVAFNNLLCYA